MPWLCALFVFLSLVILALLIKIALFYRAMDEIRTELATKLDTETNTIISVSSNNRRIRRFAAELNTQLRLLRRERRRFQSGDKELQEAISNIAHDLRTPLTAILGYLDLLGREEKSENATRYLALIENRALSLKQLTEELFHYSVITVAEQAVSLENVCLNSVLEESIAAYYEPLKQRGITPQIEIPEQRIIRHLNHATLSRIFSNILSNALKYSDGDLKISLSEAGAIVFTNTASGLDLIQVERLFHRFYTVETARKSTGLGLSIAQTLVEEMNGKITAKYNGEKLSIHVLFPLP